MNTIGVIGTGFVGKALIEGMRHAFNVYSYDKKHSDRVFIHKKGSTAHEKDSAWSASYTETNRPYKAIVAIVNNTDGPIFVCVPTPMNKDGSCNTSIVEDVVTEINKACAQINKEGQIVVIKSTVIPGTTEKLNKECTNIQVCFNPEFLTEMNANEDFKNQDRIIIGGPRPGSSIVKQCYMKAFPNVPITKTGETTAEMIKYVTNTFLATKVSFANEIKQICDQLDIDYDKVIEYATKDKRLGNSHWSVPGPMPASDGSGRLLLGYSGSCFCKDLNALIAKAKELGVDPKVMSAVWAKNLEVRPEKDWEKLIGRVVLDEND